MDDIRDFSMRRRGLPGRADGVVDGDGHAGLLLAYGATHHAVAGGNWGKDEEMRRVSVKGGKMRAGMYLIKRER